MTMHEIHEIMDRIEKAMSEQTNHGIDSIDTEEFSKVADIYKDLSEAKKAYYEAKYFETLADSMENSSNEDIMYMHDRYNKNSRRNYDSRYPYEDYREQTRMRDMDLNKGRMYYTEPNNNSGSNNGNTSRYDRARRNYTESKKMHSGNTPDDKQMKLTELDKFMSELKTDMTELITDMSNEEKAMMKQRLNSLMSAI